MDRRIKPLEPTSMQPGRNQALMISVDRHPAKAEAEERSPTLLAGETAGAQGQVRIWAPNRVLLKALAALFGFYALMLLAELFFSRLWWGQALPLLLAVSSLYAIVAAIRRPCFITIDDAGIGITTARGSKALRWSDIRTARKLSFGPTELHSRIVLRAPDPVEIHLSGYPPSCRDELFALITARAALHQHQDDKSLFTNPNRPLPIPSLMMEARSKDIRGIATFRSRDEAVGLYSSRYGVSQVDAAEAVDALLMHNDLRFRREIIPPSAASEDLPPHLDSLEIDTPI